jgi:putative oxidoreductase
MRAVFLLGRAIFGGFFIQSGLHHFHDQEMLSQYAAAKKVPAPHAAVAGSGVLALAGGLSVLTGTKPRQGLAAIVAFLVPVTLQMHRFWEVEDQKERMNETINFMKNMALAGAALMLMQVPEPWPASVDKLWSGEEDMYLRVESRERLRLMA